MSNVKNKKMINQIALKSLKARKKRNLIAILAIALTSVLFTALFTIGGSLIEKNQESTMRQVGGSAHAGYKYLTKSEYEKVAKDKGLKSVSYRIALADAENKPLIKVRTEMAYYEELEAKWSFCYPEEGHMPKKENECVASDLTLKALGVPCKIGEKFSVDFSVRGKKYSKEFILCGWYKGDRVSMSQVMCVSKKLVNQLAPTSESYQYGGDIAGSYMVDFNFKTSFNLKKQLEELNKRIGFEEKSTGVNWAYLGVKADAETVVLIVVMLGIILVSGYLIIYNIFNISVKTDIRAYGLLKNVGTTGKQLKKIVRMQAWRLSAIGIPIGLFCGYLAGLCMAPSLTADVEISAQAGKTAQTVVSANPLIFLAAILLTLLTVYLSSLQACKMVERVSPVEALRLAEGEQSHRKIKKNTSVTWWGMAVQNVLRNWKKGLIVMLSIALSMVVVNCIVMLVQGYDFDSYRKVLLASDFQLDQMTGSLLNTNFNGITPEIKEILDECPDSAKTGYVYYSEETHKMEPELLKTWEAFADKYEKNWNDYEKQVWEEAKASNTVSVHFLGISESVFDKLEWRGEKCSWDTFKSGNYVLVDYGDKYAEHPVSYYQTGDIFQMDYKNGNQKDYEVIGEALMPYALDYPYADCIYITVLVPEEEYITQTGNESAMYAAIDAKKGEDKQIKEYIDKNILKENDMINVFSVLDMKESFQRYVSKYYMIGSFLVVILAFIGIMNFFNTTATSVISRKKELALLEVVGMTKKQVSKMLVTEGFLYLGGAFVIAVLLIVFGAKQILVNTLGTAFFFRLHLTIVPCVLMIPILVGIAYVIPKYQFEKMSRESIVERIRKE